MLEAEKIRNRLKSCLEDFQCEDCEYNIHTACRHFVMMDALKLIDAQQEEIKRLKAQLDEAMLWR